mgnify:CR=1 FL=1
MQDNARRLWGEAVVADIGLVGQAVAALNVLSTRSKDGLRLDVL